MTDAEKKVILDELRKINAEAIDAAAKGATDAANKALADLEKRMGEQNRKIEEELATLKARELNPGGGGAKDADTEKYLDFVRSGARDEMTAGSNADGGFLVPTPQVTEIIRLAAAGNPMREVATVSTISGAYYPMCVRTSVGTAAKGTEAAARSNTNTPKFAEVKIYANDIYAHVPISQQLLDDAAFDVNAEINDAAAEAIAAEENTQFFTGSGSGEAQGLLSATTVADASWVHGKLGFINSGSASAITADGMIALQDALDDKYQADACWLMKKSTYTALRTLKQGANGANAYLLWNPEFVNGRLETLFMGAPVKRCSAMPTVEAGAFAVAYGNFKLGYRIVDRVGLRLLRDPYTQNPYVVFKFTKRTGGGVRNYEAIKFLKISA